MKLGSKTTVNSTASAFFVPSLLHFTALSLTALILLITVGCSESCPNGRIKSADGVCVRADMIDFATCINNAGGKVISQEQASSIRASIMSHASGGVDWRTTVRSEYAGPSQQNQLLVVDYCMKASGGLGPSSEGAAVVRGELNARRERGLRERIIDAMPRQQAFDIVCQSESRFPNAYSSDEPDLCGSAPQSEAWGCTEESNTTAGNSRQDERGPSIFEDHGPDWLDGNKDSAAASSP